jgi:hypothetical protein
VRRRRPGRGAAAPGALASSTGRRS